jgi:cardiolipin synthase
MAVGMITDYLDGTLARRNNLVSLAGKWIDPLSDFAFFFFVYLSFYTVSLMPLILLILFLLREISMYAVVRPLYILKDMDPAAKTPGKIKTVFQNAGSSIITFLAIGYRLEILSFSILRFVAIPLLSLMVAISLASMYWYVKPLVRRAGQIPRPVEETRKLVFKLVFFTVLSLFILHCLYAYIVTILYNIPTGRFVLFVLLSGAYHGLIILASMVVGKEFRLESTGEILKRMNLPLYLSFIRFTAVPTLVFLFLFIDRINARTVLVPFLSFIFLTDLFDGILARTFHQTTRIGRILDAVGDYLLISAISIVYMIIDFIPIWLFVIVLGRLVVQGAGIITLYFLRGYPYLKLSFLGKASIFAVFTIYGIELLEYLQVKGIGHPTVVWILEITVAAIVGISLLEKAILLGKSFKRAFGEQTERIDQ